MPMSLTALLAFVPAAFLLAITPGPDMLYVLSRSVAQGRVAGLISVLGFSVGMYVHATAAALGLASLFLLAPYAFDVVRLAGAGYLLWLAVQAFRGETSPLRPGHMPRAALWTVFRQAVLSNVLNPKVALFFLSLFPQFIDPHGGSIIVQSLVLATVLNIIGGSVNGGLALFAGRLGDWLGRHPRVAKWQQRIMGLTFAAIAARLAFVRD